MRQKSVIAVELEPGDETSVNTAASGHRRYPHRWRPIPVTLFVSVIGMTVYATYERLGTTANADSVELTDNLAGGFLAIGMTEDQPGFMMLSALDHEKVEVNAVQAANRVSGTHTLVEVRTPRGMTDIRLRGPERSFWSRRAARSSDMTSRGRRPSSTPYARRRTAPTRRRSRSIVVRVPNRTEPRP